MNKFYSALGDIPKPLHTTPTIWKGVIYIPILIFLIVYFCNTVSLFSINSDESTIIENSNFKKFDPSKKTIFIHVGKCGGSNIRKSLAKAITNYDAKHYPWRDESPQYEKLIFDENAQYITWIRDPMKRFVSGFNWRKNLYSGNPMHFPQIQPPKEIKYLNEFQTANNLSEHLFTNDDANDAVEVICHLMEGPGYYFSKYMDEKYFDQFVFVGVQEYMDEDVEMLENIVGKKLQVEKKYDYPEGKDKYLSEKAKKNLRKLLHADYAAIEMLIKKGLVNEEKVKSYFNSQNKEAAST